MILDCHPMFEISLMSGDRIESLPVRDMSRIPEYYRSEEWISLRTYVLRRDGHICQYCGDKAVQADHVHPRSKGGRDHPSNLVACCVVCNHIAGGNIFPSFEDKKKYIERYRKKRAKTKKKNKRKAFLRIFMDWTN